MIIIFLKKTFQVNFLKLKNKLKLKLLTFLSYTGLPHTQENSGNFQVEENLREVLIFTKKFREVLRF